MNFNQHDLKVFADKAEKREIVIVEGKNGLGQKFKTIGCFMPNRNTMGDFTYILNNSFGLFQGEYDQNGEKQYCTFLIDPDAKNATKDCLFVDTIKASNGQLIYKNPNYQRVLAFVLYNKIIQQKGYDYTPSQIHNNLLMHIGKPMTYKKSTGTLTSLLTKNNVTFATFTTGEKQIEGIVQPFEVHQSNNAKKNLKDYSIGQEHEQC